MQSSHNALRRNIISNWFYDLIALRVDALSKQLHQALVFGEDTDVIYLHFEYPVRLYSTFSSIFTAECGLRPFHFCQFFGGEVIEKVQKKAQFSFSLVERCRKIFIHCRLLRKFKRKLSFLFVGKGKLFITKLFLEEFNLIFFTVERLACFEMQPRRRRF